VWNATLRAYRSRQWDQAELNMRNLLRMNPTCGLYHAYCERLAEKRRNPPPPDWDGVTAFDEK
jgi:adenylate cyclase